MARATSSLPVPLSPVISTEASVGATSAIRLKTSCIAGLRAQQLLAQARPASPAVRPRPVAAMRQRPVDHRGGLLQVERLGQVIERAVLHRGDGHVQIAEGRDDDDRNRAGQLGQTAASPTGRRCPAGARRARPGRATAARPTRTPPRPKPPRSPRGPSPSAAARGPSKCSLRRRRSVRGSCESHSAKVQHRSRAVGALRSIGRLALRQRRRRCGNTTSKQVGRSAQCRRIVPPCASAICLGHGQPQADALRLAGGERLEQPIERRSGRVPGRCRARAGSSPAACGPARFAPSRPSRPPRCR